MRSKLLENVRVAVLAMDGVDRSEIVETTRELRSRGATIEIVSARTGTLLAFDNLTPSVTIPVDRTFGDVSPHEYDALLIPGGTLSADALRAISAAQALVTSFDAADKPIAASCHGPWLLASADILGGRTVTSYHTIHDDMENAGATWLDEPVVVDGNLLTSRHPSDLPLFNARMVELFGAAVRV